MSRTKWDTALGMQMWLEGKTDAEIAEHFGLAKTTVTSFRIRNWERHKDPNVPAQEASPEEVAPVQPEASNQKRVSMDCADGVYSILEEATKSKAGIEAICTADAILCLWNWSSADDLRRARAAINYLIKKIEG